MAERLKDDAIRVNGFRGWVAYWEARLLLFTLALFALIHDTQAGLALDKRVRPFVNKMDGSVN